MRVATFLNLSIYAITSLCHSAFVRVATVYLDILLCCAYFATAHSCGLRLLVLFALVHRASLPQRIRAGCDEDKIQASWIKGASLPQRIRAGCDKARLFPPFISFSLCHSAFVRVATRISFRRCCPMPSLPQRIRAGCDFHAQSRIHALALCHSAFVRVATRRCGRQSF